MAAPVVEAVAVSHIVSSDMYDCCHPVIPRVRAQFIQPNLDGVDFITSPIVSTPTTAAPVLTGVVIPPDPECNNEVVESIESTIIDVHP